MYIHWREGSRKGSTNLNESSIECNDVNKNQTNGE